MTFHRLAVLGLLLALAPLPASAWGQLGHRYVGTLGARNFPKDIPAFLRSAEAIRMIGEMSREPDRSRNAGQPHDWDLDPGHQIDGSDDGTVMGGPKLSALPPSRRDFDTALRAVGSNEYSAGFLPYNIMEGWQQLVKDFAMWRADVAGVKFAKSRAERQWYEMDRKVRELLTLRDLGYWSHFVGDGSQPLHVTIHYDGWGDGPNPQGFDTERGFHSKFETDFVNKNIAEADVLALMRPYRDCACALQPRVQDYLIATLSNLTKAYELQKAHAYDPATPEAKTFVAQRIADGAAMFRDLVIDAWRASGEATVGYRDKIAIRDLEAGKFDSVVLMREMRD